MNQTVDDLIPVAKQLIREDLHPDADPELILERVFETHPLSDPGTTALFSFQPFLKDGKEDRYFIFVGNAMPMIYPNWELTIDELWAVHLGTEYFVKMGVTEDAERKSPVFLSYLKMVATVFQEQLYIYKPDSIKIEKIYVLKDQKHVVGRAAFDNKIYTWIVGDIPHFVYKKDLPPHVVWSLHMGKILLT